MAVLTKLREIAIISAGQSAPQGNHNYSTEGIPFIKAGDLVHLLNGKKETELRRVTDEVAASHKLKLFPKGSILFAKSGMSCNKGYIHVLRSDCYVVSHLACITPTSVSSQYLKYYFEFHKPNRLIKDEAYPSISLSDISNIELLLPSDKDQCHIAAVLDKISSIIAMRTRQLEKFDELVKSRFVEMFGDPVTNPMGWNVKKLSEVCDVRDGTHDSPKYVLSGYPLMTSKNFTNGFVDFSNVNFISEDDYEAINKRSKVDLGDIVLPMIGTIGHPVIIDTDRPFAIKNVALIKTGHMPISNIYVQAILNSAHFKSLVAEKNRGNTQKFIALGDIRNFMIPIPPLDLQHQFADFVSHVDKSRLVARASLEKMITLKAALMQIYFSA